MRHLRKYNESYKSNLIDDLKDFFANTIDLCDEHSIEVIYFNPDDPSEWAKNDFSNSNSEYLPDECVMGYSLSFIRNINPENLEGLEKYKNFTDELYSDVYRFLNIYNPKYYIIYTNTFEITLNFYKE